VQQPQQPDPASPASAASSSSSESDSCVLVERRPIPGHNAGYLVVTLNRPKQSNALDMALLHDLQGVFDTLPK
jgi:enoyl-CoA hydratase/carnithine racemase